MLQKSVRYGFYLYLHLPHWPWEFLKFKDWVLFTRMLIHHPSEAFVEPNKLYHYQLLLCGRFRSPKTATTISSILHLILRGDLARAIRRLVSPNLNLGRLVTTTREMGGNDALGLPRLGYER